MASVSDDTLPMQSPPCFHLLAKPSGSTCNIDCAYCFFLSKEALYPNEKHRMSDETLEAYISQLLDSHRTPSVTVAWQGGEPTLMKVEFFRRSVELVEKYRVPGRPFSTPFRRTEFCSTMSGAISSRNTTFWSASAWMGHANSTIPTASTAAKRARSTA